MYKRELPPKIKAVLPQEAIESLQRGYTLTLKKQGEEAKVTKGASYFGSGNYFADYKVLKGNVKILDQRTWDNGFVSATDYIITATTTPTVVTASASDAVAREGRRYFQKEVIVWI